MVVTVLQVVVVPIFLALIAAFAGLFRGPKSRLRSSIDKDVAILKELPADVAVREDLLALIRYEVQKLQQLEGYVTEEQIDLPPETERYKAARAAAVAERRRATSRAAQNTLLVLGVVLVAIPMSVGLSELGDRDPAAAIAVVVSMIATPFAVSAVVWFLRR